MDDWQCDMCQWRYEDVNSIVVNGIDGVTVQQVSLDKLETRSELLCRSMWGNFQRQSSMAGNLDIHQSTNLAGRLFIYCDMLIAFVYRCRFSMIERQDSSALII